MLYICKLNKKEPMKNTFMVLLLAVLYLLLPMATTDAQVSRNAELERLLRVLPIGVDSIHDGVNRFNVRGRDIVVTSRCGQVQTVGYLLFSDETRRAMPVAVANFLEGYFLRIDHPQADRPSARMMREDHFYFLYGSQSVVATLRPDDDFALESDGRRYTATWRRNGRRTLSVHFPASHELLSSETKVESEQNLETDMLAAQPVADEAVDEGDLLSTAQPGFLIKKGNTHLNRLFASDTYYRRQDGDIKLVADADHPLETVANMLVSPAFTPSRTMTVKQVMYGFKTKEFDTSLSQWIAFCLSTGCQIYYGMESLNEQAVKATVIAVNPAENYNHVLAVDVPTAALTDSSVSIRARLDAYVPMHNVTRLLEPYKSQSKVKRTYTP